MVVVMDIFNTSWTFSEISLTGGGHVLFADNDDAITINNGMLKGDNSAYLCTKPSLFNFQVLMEH